MKKFTIVFILLTIAALLYKFGVYRTDTGRRIPMGKAR